MTLNAGSPEVLVLPVGIILECGGCEVVLAEIPEEWGQTNVVNALVDAGTLELCGTGGIVIGRIVLNPALLAICPVGVVSCVNIEFCKLAGIEKVNLASEGLYAV